MNLQLGFWEYYVVTVVYILFVLLAKCITSEIYYLWNALCVECFANGCITCGMYCLSSYYLLNALSVECITGALSEVAAHKSLAVN